nr:hypothetical protein [Micromonospora sp. DSM 115978]
MTRSSAAVEAARMAMVEVSVAAAVIPSAWPVAQIVYFNQCDPQAIIRAGVDWLHLHDRLDDARAAPHPANERRELRTRVVAVVVGVTLICVGTMLFLLVIAYTVVSTILAAFAHLVTTAAAGAASGAAAAGLSTANSFAVSALSLLRHVEAVSSEIGKRGAAAISRAMTLDAALLDVEASDLAVLDPEAAAGLPPGRGGTLRELAHATVDGSERILTGLLVGWTHAVDGETAGWGPLFAHDG